MPFSRRQRGIIQLGLLGIIVLAAGLFVASKLVSNPDLTFFNINEEAKDVEKAKCAGIKNGYIFRWDRNSNSCKKKEMPKMLRKSEKAQDTKLSGCGSGRDCKDKKFAGAKGCLSGSKTIYCCSSQEHEINGECKKDGGCNNFVCSDRPVGGSTICYDSANKSGRYCCPKGKHIDTKNNTCTDVKTSD